MFEKERDENEQRADVKGDAEAVEEAENDEQAPHHEVNEEGELEGVLGSPADHERVEVVFAVEVVILNGVDDVEADEPADDSKPKDDGDDVDGSTDGEPGADGSEREGDAEVDVGEVGEAFGQ